MDKMDEWMNGILIDGWMDRSTTMLRNANQKHSSDATLSPLVGFQTDSYSL